MSNANKVIAGLREAIDWVTGDRSKARVTLTDPEAIKRRAQNVALTVLLDHGFHSPRFFGEEHWADHWAAIIPRGSFFAIVDGDSRALANGFINRWNYGTIALAEEALAEWNGVGEPRRWFSKDIAANGRLTVWP